MSMFFDWDVATWIFSHIPAWMSISNPWYGFVSNWELIILKSSGLTANFRLPHFRTISYCTHIVFHRSIFWQGNLHGWTACPADGVSRLGNKHVMELDPDVSGSDDFWRPQPLEPEVFSPAELGKTWELRICSSCSSLELVTFSASRHGRCKAGCDPTTEVSALPLLIQQHWEKLSRFWQLLWNYVYPIFFKRV